MVKKKIDVEKELEIERTKKTKDILQQFYEENPKGAYYNFYSIYRRRDDVVRRNLQRQDRRLEIWKSVPKMGTFEERIGSNSFGPNNYGM